ncbi:hypothetical protein BCR39DRAFT_581337 [Naematelia encephala]|uniref:Uncharacterized protein n=1 Tax=Naematelia encephala TaxID=71784 RepID=A0A1Y2AQX9_9TREE|nr:hypothetical protein BCR39DRAFT_581337 [Naematelia encephala]
MKRSRRFSGKFAFISFEPLLQSVSPIPPNAIPATHTLPLPFVVDGREMKMGSTGGNLYQPIDLHGMGSIHSVIDRNRGVTKVVVRVKDVSLHSLLTSRATSVPPSVTTIHFGLLQASGGRTSDMVGHSRYRANEKPKLHLETTDESAYTERDIANLHRSIFDIIAFKGRLIMGTSGQKQAIARVVGTMKQITSSFAITSNMEQSDVIPEESEVYKDWCKNYKNSAYLYSRKWDPQMFGSTPSSISRLRSD